MKSKLTVCVALGSGYAANAVRNGEGDVGIAPDWLLVKVPVGETFEKLLKASFPHDDIRKWGPDEGLYAIANQVPFRKVMRVLRRKYRVKVVRVVVDDKRFTPNMTRWRYFELMCPLGYGIVVGVILLLRKLRRWETGILVTLVLLLLFGLVRFPQ